MTTHINYDYRCPKCKTPYIPLSKEQQACANCGTLAPEPIEIIPRLVEAAKNNKTWPAWMPMTTGDFYVAQGISMMFQIEENSLKVPKDDAGLVKLCEKLLPEQMFSQFPNQRPHALEFAKQFLREAYSK